MPYAVNANNKSQRKRKIDERKEEEPFGSMAKTRLKKKYHSTFFVPSCERSKQLWASVSGWVCVCVCVLSPAHSLSVVHALWKNACLCFLCLRFLPPLFCSLWPALLLCSLYGSLPSFFRFSSDWLMFLAVLYTLPFLSKKTRILCSFIQRIKYKINITYKIYNGLKNASNIGNI